MPDDIKPFTDYALYGSKENQKLGQEAIAQGKMGCIILSGGQGTRLGAAVPKGILPVSVIRRKSLLQLFCERTLAASKKANRKLPLAIMTSPLNHKAIQEHVKDYPVALFSQGMHPFQDETGNWLEQSGPDGNGSFLKAFYESGLFKEWKDAGVEVLNIIQVDNALADPFDAELCGYHINRQAEATLKAIKKLSPSESVGSIVERAGSARVIEYSEFPNDPSYDLANITLLCFQMSFLEKIKDFPLPWHKARKQNVWKYEKFIFDLLEFTNRVNVLLYPREICYAPLKNPTQQESVEKALLERDCMKFFQITGVRAPEGRVFELDPAFYYLTDELALKWSGKSLPEKDYIEVS